MVFQAPTQIQSFVTDFFCFFIFFVFLFYLCLPLDGYKQNKQLKICYFTSSDAWIPFSVDYTSNVGMNQMTIHIGHVNFCVIHADTYWWIVSAWEYVCMCACVGSLYRIIFHCFQNEVKLCTSLISARFFYCNLN